jgi:hypothetical protein
MSVFPVPSLAPAPTAWGAYPVHWRGEGGSSGEFLPKDSERRRLRSGHGSCRTPDWLLTERRNTGLIRRVWMPQQIPERDYNPTDREENYVRDQARER